MKLSDCHPSLTIKLWDLEINMWDAFPTFIHVRGYK